jgi:ADP-ribose pyrophosphatase YjhB (NUDIX family)
MSHPNANEKDTDPRVWVVISSLLKPNLILLGRRSVQCNNPGAYGLFGGHVDVGESVLDAAARELKEETGITVDQNDFMTVATGERKGAHLTWVHLDVGGFGNQYPSFTNEVDGYLWFDAACSDQENEIMDNGVKVPLDLHYSIKRYLKTEVCRRRVAKFKIPLYVVKNPG